MCDCVCVDEDVSDHRVDHLGDGGEWGAVSLRLRCMFFCPTTHHLQRRLILALSAPFKAPSHPPRPSHLCTAPRRVSGMGPASTREVSRLKQPQLTILSLYIYVHTQGAAENTNDRQTCVREGNGGETSVDSDAAAKEHEMRRRTRHVTSVWLVRTRIRVECAPV